jgi:uncharacterized membrane protein
VTNAAPSGTVPSTPAGSPAARLAYLDWLRGLAVLVMIEAHAVDAWTRAADRHSRAYMLAVMVAGMGAPLFLFLAGVAVSLAAGGRARRIGPIDAARSVRRRGWQIFGLAFLFRLYSWVLSPGSPVRSLLKVDILNIMGPSIVLAAWIWQLGSTTWRRAAWLATATVAIALVTPIVRTTMWLDPLPDPIETYFRPGKGLATFALFPWMAFVTAGAVCGLAIHAAGSARAAHAAAWCLACGLGLAAGGYALSFRPSIYPQSFFWTTSPAFLCLRVGILVLAVALAWAWDRRPWRVLSWSPLQVLGASSLFVYWIHIELVYGFIATPLRRALSLSQVFLAFALFSALMLGVTIWKNRLLASRAGRTGSVHAARGGAEPVSG